MKDHFDQASRITNISTPILIFHGEKDKTVPINLGKVLFDKALEPKYSKWFENAGHNDLFDFGAGKLSVSFIWQIIPPSSNVE